MADEEQGLSKRTIRKNTYWAKLEGYIHEYKHALIVSVDFVGSKQLQDVRLAIRGQGVIVLGKNTIMRKVIRDNAEKNPKLEGLLPHIKGNMGFIFTNGDLNALRKKVIAFKMPAAAKQGVIAPVDVTIPAGNTGLDPGQTSFFQTLNIATKITKGSIEITTNVTVCNAGLKVSASAVALLNKLGIRPFEYGIVVGSVYEDGSIYDAAVLDLSQDDLIGLFGRAVAALGAISFEVGQINAATVPHSIGRAFRNLLQIAITTDYEFEQMDIVREMIKNPGAFGGGGGGGGGAAAAAAPAAAEEEEEEEAAPAMDMFGGGGDGDEAAADY